MRERLARVRLSEGEIAARKRKLAELYAKGDATPIVDDRTPDEVIGYNEFGHFD